MRVATSTMNAALVSQSLQVQARYNVALVQQSSGQKSQSLAGLDGAAGLSVNLKSDLKTSEHLVTQAGAGQSAVDIAYGAVAGLVDLVAAAKADIAGVINGSVETTDGLQAKAEGWLADTADLLNTEAGGTYVFGGSGADTPPVDLSDPAYDPLADPTVADTGYYRGSGTTTALMVDGSQSLTYGVTADADGFETTLRAFSMLAEMTTDPPDMAALQDAYALLDTAAADLGRLQEDLSGQSGQLAALIDRETGFQLYAESALETVESVDVAEAAAKVSELEVVLEASYSALASITSLSLTDYLR